MDKFDSPWLLSRESLGPVERGLLALFALIPLWPVWDLVVRPWPAVLGLFGLLVLPIVLGALAISSVLWFAALLAPEREVLVDPAARAVLDSGRARWLGLRRRAYPFEDIEAVLLEREPETDGPDRLRLALRLRGERRSRVLLIRPQDQRPALEALAARLRAALQP